MDVFISWSGQRSGGVAEALRSWLPQVINAVKPWLSSADIDKGARWSSDVASKLGTSKVGIICITPENVHADWILFEAGALSKTLENTFVCPLLVGLRASDIRGPLAQFQATGAAKDDIRRLVRTINTALEDKGRPDRELDEAFDVWWPKLEARLSDLPAVEETSTPQRSDRDILEEILAMVRNQARDQSTFRVFSTELAARAARLRGEVLHGAGAMGLTDISFTEGAERLYATFNLKDGTQQTIDFLYRWATLPDKYLHLRVVDKIARRLRVPRTERTEGNAISEEDRLDEH